MFHRLPRILAELRALDAAHLDRRAVEILFGVRQRRARQLMAGLPSLQVGNAVAVSRASLIERLETTAQSDPFQWEISRRTRVADSLGAARKLAAARKVRLPTAADAGNRTVRDLAPAIELRPGELRIRFHSAQDLAARLFELSHTMAGDWESFVKVVRELQN